MGRVLHLKRTAPRDQILRPFFANIFSKYWCAVSVIIIIIIIIIMIIIIIIIIIII